MGRFRNVFVLAGAVVLGNDGAAADGNTHEQVDDQVDDRPVGTDRRQRVAADVFADDDDIGGVEDELQYPRGHQRQGKQQDLLRQRAGTHIDFIPMAYGGGQGVESAPLRKVGSECGAARRKNGANGLLTLCVL